MKHAAPPKRPAAVTAVTVFLLAFVLFGGIIFIPLLTKTASPQPPIEADGVPAYVWQVGLFFYDGDRLTGVVRLTVDTQTMSMTATGYPPSADVSGRTLQQHAADGAVQAFAALCENEGCASDGVLSISVSNTAAFIVHLKERVELDLPEPMGILPAGRGTLTPMQVADLLRHTAWAGGEAVQAQLHAQTVAALFNRYLFPDRDLDADFRKLTTLCDDPPNISQYAKTKEILQALAQHNDGNLCSWTETAGAF